MGNLFFLLYCLCAILSLTEGRSSLGLIACALLRHRDRPSDEIDAALRLPKVDQAVAAVERAPHTLVVLRTANATLVATRREAPSSSSLATPLGAREIAEIASSPSVHFAATGFAGDSRALHRRLRRSVIEHVHAFGMPPPLRQLAETARKEVAKHLRSASRPLAVHGFLFDCTVRGSLFEVKPTAEALRVAAGVAGRDNEALRQRLEEIASNRSRTNQSEELISQSQSHAHSLVKEEKEKGSVPFEDLSVEEAQEILRDLLRSSAKDSRSTIAIKVFPHISQP